MKSIAEANQIIKPVSVTDGAGVKIKRSIGLNPDYFDPFLMLDEFGSENKDDYIAGFPPHPHRGIETVTYMLAGDFEHKDSLGSIGRMGAGDVQWMKTGSGIIHSEMPLMKEGKLHGFQLWINMPSNLKMTKPDYLYLDAKDINHYADSEKSVKVIAGKFEDINGTISNAKQSLEEVNMILYDIKNGDGTLTRLINDSTVYMSITQMIDEATRLVENIKTEPKRYVQFSIFGKKDKSILDSRDKKLLKKFAVDSLNF